MNISFLKGYSW